MKFYGSKELTRQISFLSYYFHWSLQEILLLPHLSREMLCNQINQIHREMNNEGKNIFDV